MPYITPHFRTEEFTCPCCQRSDMDPTLVQVLELIRAPFGQPMKIIEGGGWRCRRYNVRMRYCEVCRRRFHGLVCPDCRGKGRQRSYLWSRHMMGTEVDIVIPVVDPEVVATLCETDQKISKLVKNIGIYWTYTHIGIGGNSQHRWDARGKGE